MPHPIFERDIVRNVPMVSLKERLSMVTRAQNFRSFTQESLSTRIRFCTVNRVLLVEGQKN